MFKIRADVLRYVIAIVFLAGSALLGLAAYDFMMKRLIPSDETGSFYAVKCRSCGKSQERSIVDIKNTRCQFCKKNELCYMMTCNSCNNVFPFRSDFPKNVKSKDEMMDAMQKMNKCPSCGSSKIEPSYTSVKLLKKLKSGKDGGGK